MNLNAKTNYFFIVLKISRAVDLIKKHEHEFDESNDDEIDFNALSDKTLSMLHSFIFAKPKKASNEVTATSGIKADSLSIVAMDFGGVNQSVVDVEHAQSMVNLMQAFDRLHLVDFDMNMSFEPVFAMDFGGVNQSMVDVQHGQTMASLMQAFQRLHFDVEKIKNARQISINREYEGIVGVEFILTSTDKTTFFFTEEKWFDFMRDFNEAASANGKLNAIDSPKTLALEFGGVACEEPNENISKCIATFIESTDESSDGSNDESSDESNDESNDESSSESNESNISPSKELSPTTLDAMLVYLYIMRQ